LTKKEEFERDQAIRGSFEFDILKMYFGDDYISKSGVKIREPSIGEILEIGEKSFYEMLNVFVTNPTQYRLPLWKMGADWNKISDFELFCILFNNINAEVSKAIFPETDFKNLNLYSEKIDEENSQIVLANKDGTLIIRNIDYLEISQYLRALFFMNPKVERAKGKATKEAIIWEDEELLRKRKEEGFSSNLLPTISSCINHPGFKYNLQELKELGIYAFMDSVQRLQVYESTRALMGGMYSGMVDLKGVPKENFNFMRDISINAKTK